MFLILSGEGATDIGVNNKKVGPMTKCVDAWIEPRLNYSLIETNAYNIVTKQELSEVAKSEIKPLSRRGKKQPPETRYFYKNARALAKIAINAQKERNDEDVIPVLFRDADGTASAGRGEWNAKWQSMLNGFEAEGIEIGVPMIPKPKSEAWVLCALRDHYEHCGKLEDASGNDASPKSLKKQLEAHLSEPATRELLNNKVDEGELDVVKIIDMPSLTAFKDRLDQVLDSMRLPSRT